MSELAQLEPGAKQTKVRLHVPSVSGVGFHLYPVKVPVPVLESEPNDEPVVVRIPKLVLNLGRDPVEYIQTNDEPQAVHIAGANISDLDSLTAWIATHAELAKTEADPEPFCLKQFMDNPWGVVMNRELGWVFSVGMGHLPVIVIHSDCTVLGMAAVELLRHAMNGRVELHLAA